MKKLSKHITLVLCLMVLLSSCYNSKNSEQIIGKWKGTYIENCPPTMRTSSVEIEFKEDKTFTAIITAPHEKPAMTSGTYVMQRYQLIFINNRKERDIQKIEFISDAQFEGSFSNDRCNGTTKLRKVQQ